MQSRLQSRRAATAVQPVGRTLFMGSEDSYWDWLRDDAAAYRLESWEFRKFHSVPALFTRDGRFAQAYNGEPFDETKWELRENGWDHEHCRFCNTCICDADDDHQESGWTSEGAGEWLCGICYQRIIVACEDPETVLMEDGAN